MLPVDIQTSLLHEAGLSIKEAHSLTGGCIHQAAQLTTSQGDFFIKWNSLQQAHNLAVEAKGLQLLRSTETSASLKSFSKKIQSITATYSLLIFSREIQQKTTGHTLAEAWLICIKMVVPLLGWRTIIT